MRWHAVNPALEWARSLAVGRGKGGERLLPSLPHNSPARGALRRPHFLVTLAVFRLRAPYQRRKGQGAPPHHRGAGVCATAGRLGHSGPGAGATWVPWALGCLGGHSVPRRALGAVPSTPLHAPGAFWARRPGSWRMGRAGIIWAAGAWGHHLGREGIIWAAGAWGPYWPGVGLPVVLLTVDL